MHHIFRIVLPLEPETNAGSTGANSVVVTGILHIKFMATNAVGLITWMAVLHCYVISNS